MILELAAAATIAAAPPPVTFGFEAVSAKPGDRVVLHVDRARARTVRLYLVERSAFRRIRSAQDARLWFIASARPRGGHAVVPFFVPPARSGTYVPWCAGCGKRVTGVLRIVMTANAEACPVTKPNGLPPRGLDPQHGNGLLSTFVPSFSPANVNADGSIGHKLYWFGANGDGDLLVTGRRIDASAPSLGVGQINRGTDGRSWATVVKFPARGCWLIRARLVDYSRRTAVDIAYVVKVDPR